MAGMTEKQIHAAVIKHWLALAKPKTLVCTIPNDRAFGQAGLTPGLPDLMVVTPEIGVGFIELKRDEKSKVSKAQEQFKSLCIVNGINHSITRGRSEPIEILEHWGAVKRARDRNA